MYPFLPWEGRPLPLEVLSQCFLDLVEQVSKALQLSLAVCNVEDIHHQW